MTRPDNSALGASRGALRFLITANWIFGGAVLALLVSTFVARAWVGRALGFDGDARLLQGGRLIMVIGVLATPVVNVVFSRLLEIVDTVRAGDPFVTTNARRLHSIAWAVVALEVSRFVVVGIARAVSSSTRPLDIRLDLSVTPWLAVLLLFVLARVFDQGARMREELAGTV